MNPITRRPVACSTTAAKRSRFHLLELHPLLDRGVTAAAAQQRLLDAGEPAAQHADDEIVQVIRLGLRGAAPVVTRSYGGGRATAVPSDGLHLRAMRRGRVPAARL
jgi:hypothetical protein